MLHAEIHGKLGREASEHERNEDALTSSVWGTLFVAGAWPLVRDWLACARHVAGPKVAPLDTGSDDHWYCFWPNLHEAQPDLLVRVGSVLFVIEVKYLSRLSGTGIDEVGKLRDQLARQWRSVADEAHVHRYPREVCESIKAATARIVYLVPASANKRARDEIADSSVHVPDAPILLLFWEDLHAILQRRLAAPLGDRKTWKRELARLLERRGLRTYSGVGWTLDKLPVATISALARLRRLQPAPWTPRFSECVAIDVALADKVLTGGGRWTIR